MTVRTQRKLETPGPGVSGHGGPSFSRTMRYSRKHSSLPSGVDLRNVPPVSTFSDAVCSRHGQPLWYLQPLAAGRGRGRLPRTGSPRTGASRIARISSSRSWSSGSPVAGSGCPGRRSAASCAAACFTARVAVQVRASLAMSAVSAAPSTKVRTSGGSSWRKSIADAARRRCSSSAASGAELPLIASLGSSLGKRAEPTGLLGLVEVPSGAGTEAVSSGAE
eukprot:scaffold118203_cov63-Phaeocystis_antarctica.AAC.2